MSTRFLVIVLATGFACSSINAQECFAAANTLTTACNGTCGAYEPCLHLCPLKFTAALLQLLHTMLLYTAVTAVYSNIV
ncbi:hypothetical protein PF011_g14169 [Phytophthora fragariae]|uniref:4Fe-4S ferredoxin-type domain-containing protein n=1 Tax=Phytophthora fragariae TaxID=53985 RepID=A0A6A3K4C3_9STRA|nr:hypothetical protein PF011_g14169 [Phytophthora fragariae]